MIQFEEPLNADEVKTHFKRNFFSNLALEDLEKTEKADHLELFGDLEFKSVKKRTEKAQAKQPLNFKIIVINLANIEDKLYGNEKVEIIYDRDPVKLPKIVIHREKVNKEKK